MMNSLFKSIIKRFFLMIFPELKLLFENNNCLSSLVSHEDNVEKEKHVVIYHPYNIINIEVGAFTYIGKNSNISNTKIGKFCSIGPNFICGWGLHPSNGISTAPMFYSKENKSNGVSICNKTKFIEQKKVTIGNDVFIGANVFILDGITIGNGAIIGAGAVVVNDIPDYAIAVGVPAKVNKYRFKNEIIRELTKIQWWDFNEEDLKIVENYFYNVEEFIEKCSKK